MSWDDRDVTDRYAELDAIRLHYVEAGAGRLIVFLHGFPEFWYSWRHQISPLAANGFHVVAVDMRGYNLSDKPKRVDAYRLDVLAADLSGLIRACGAERAIVVGHDWGGVVAWQFAISYPEMIDRLVIMNAPHPAMTQQALRSVRQLARSWYIFFFQLPWLPEALLRAGNFAFMRWVWRTEPVRPGAFSEEDIQRYMEAAARPGALTAGINYYRAVMRQNPLRIARQLIPIEVPTLIIWGEQDRYLGRELADPPRRWVPNARVERLPDASHWVQSDQPEQVTALLLEFLADHAL